MKASTVLFAEYRGHLVRAEIRDVPKTLVAWNQKVSMAGVEGTTRGKQMTERPFEVAIDEE